MPQWRKLHTKTTESFDVNDMPDDFTRLMWVLLPLKLCREGRGVDLAAWIKSQVFPLRADVTMEMVDDAMDWFEDRGMVHRYVVDDRPYFQITSWDKYQGNTDREAPSPYPGPDEADESHDSGPTHEQVASKSSTDVDVDVDVDVDTDADTTTDANGGVGVGQVATVYENEIGSLTALISDNIQDAVDEFGGQWVCDAIGIAAENNVRKWSYVDGILKRWRSDGRYSSRASPSDNGTGESAVERAERLAQEVHDEMAQ